MLVTLASHVHVVVVVPVQANAQLVFVLSESSGVALLALEDCGAVARLAGVVAS